jgi:hypothetical protein
LLLRIQILRIQMLELHARAALAMAEIEADPTPFLRHAEEDARKLEREGQAWALAHARFIRAGLAAGREDSSAALHQLEEAAGLYNAVDMSLNAAVMRFRWGEIAGGPEGKQHMALAEEILRGQSIASPELWVRMIAPGFSRVAASRAETSY